jgi:hypothetical protein
MPRIMLDDPDQTLEMLRDSVATLARRTDGADVLRRRRAAGDEMDAGLWAEMAEAGWLGILLPEQMGGSALGMAELAVLAEAFGRALITEPFAALAVLPGALLSRIGGQVAGQVASGIADGSRIVPVLWQDLRGEPAPLSLTPDGDAWRMSGVVDYVSGARSATDYLAVCERGGERLLVLLPAGSEGFSLSFRPGLDGAMIGRVNARDVWVGGGQVLARGEVVDTALSGAIETARFALAAELAGVGASALEKTVAYTSERVQFGRPIASFQVIQHRLVDMWGEAEFACSAVANAAEMADEETAENVGRAVLAAKARAGDSAVSITRRAIHLHGAMGFTDECDIGLYNKRAISLNAMLGQSEELRLDFLARETAA